MSWNKRTLNVGIKVWYHADTHPERLRNKVEKVFSICCNLETESPQEKRQGVRVLFQKRVDFDSQRKHKKNCKAGWVWDLRSSWAGEWWCWNQQNVFRSGREEEQCLHGSYSTGRLRRCRGRRMILNILCSFCISVGWYRVNSSFGH